MIIRNYHVVIISVLALLLGIVFGEFGLGLLAAMSIWFTHAFTK